MATENKKENKKEEKGIVPVGSEFDRMFRNMMKEMEEFERHFSLWRPYFGIFPRFPRIFDEFEKFEIAKPAIDIVDKGDRFEATADIPGIPKENLEVNVTDNEIEIKGKFEEKKEEGGKRYVRQERKMANIYRCVSLPEEVIPDKATAKMENGILKISLPKKKPTEEPKTRKIKIE